MTTSGARSITQPAGIDATPPLMNITDASTPISAIGRPRSVLNAAPNWPSANSAKVPAVTIVMPMRIIGATAAGLLGRGRITRLRSTVSSCLLGGFSAPLLARHCRRMRAGAVSTPTHHKGRERIGLPADPPASVTALRRRSAPSWWSAAGHGSLSPTRPR